MDQQLEDRAPDRRWYYRPIRAVRELVAVNVVNDGVTYYIDIGIITHISDAAKLYVILCTRIIVRLTDFGRARPRKRRSFNDVFEPNCQFVRLLYSETNLSVTFYIYVCVRVRRILLL